MSTGQKSKRDHRLRNAEKYRAIGREYYRRLTPEQREKHLQRIRERRREMVQVIRLAFGEAAG
jgi:Spy/CpxP family protein refolding chaperone